MKFPHTHFRKGQRVRIVFRSGDVTHQKFVERRGRTILVESETGERFEIATRLLKSVSIYRMNGARMKIVSTVSA